MMGKDHGDAPGKGKKSGIFVPLWPSGTAGDGRVGPNNRNPGGAQGKPSTKLKAKCQQCGFPSDLNKDDNSGGSLDGNGAIGPSSATIESWTDQGGATVTESNRSATTKHGGGCKFCGSKNWAKAPPRNSAFPSPESRSGI